MIDPLLDNLPLILDADGDGKRIRDVILQLAVRGRLVRQEEEWDEQPLASIVNELRPGFACSKSHQKAGGIVHLRTHNVGSAGEFNQDLLVTIDPAQVDPKKRGIRKDDVIFNNTNSRELVGKSCLVPSDLDYAYSNHMTLLRPGPRLTGTFLWCCLQVYWRSGFFQKTCKAWIGQAGVDTRAVGALQIPLPTLAEQHRIVAKVDELTSHAAVLEERHLAASTARVRLRDAALHGLAEAEDHDAVETAWQRIEEHFEDLFTEPEDVAPLRQAVLQLAVRGRLVGQDAGDEPAARTLQMSRDAIAACHASGETPKPRFGRLRGAGAEKHPLPPGWIWAPLGSCGVVLDHKREPVKSADRASRTDGKPASDLFPYFGATQQAGWIDDFIFDEELLLLGEDGAPFFTRGRSVAYVVRGKCWVNNHAHVFRGIAATCDYLAYALNTCDYHGFVSGTTRLKLTQGQMVDLPVPLPPLPEQHRIVAKVDELMALCDTLEASLTRAKAAREQFAASISAALDADPTQSTDRDAA